MSRDRSVQNAMQPLRRMVAAITWFVRNVALTFVGFVLALGNLMALLGMFQWCFLFSVFSVFLYSLLFHVYN